MKIFSLHVDGSMYPDSEVECLSCHRKWIGVGLGEDKDGNQQLFRAIGDGFDPIYVNIASKDFPHEKMCSYSYENSFGLLEQVER